MSSTSLHATWSNGQAVKEYQGTIADDDTREVFIHTRCIPRFAPFCNDWLILTVRLTLIG